LGKDRFLHKVEITLSPYDMDSSAHAYKNVIQSLVILGNRRGV